MANARHKRDTNARRQPKAITLAGGLALSLTASAVVLGVAFKHPSSHGQDLVALNGPASGVSLAPAALDRSRTLSRAGSAGLRVVKPTTVKPKAARRTAGPELPAVHRTTEWTTTDLNLWPTAAEHDRQVGLLDSGSKVVSLGITVDGRDEIEVKGAPRWVTAGYLSTDKPLTATAGLSDAPCPDMSVESGLAADTIRLYHAVCHAFPQVTDYLGWGARTEHDTGHALDVMVYGDKALGDAVAAWAQAHAAELNLYDVIWYDRIWTPVRAAEGWRDYGDHGSPTANHMDHVHIGTN